MHTNILSWIRKRQFMLQLFVAVMVNMMVFSQPLHYVLNSQKIINRTYYGSNSGVGNTIHQPNTSSTSREQLNDTVVVSNDKNVLKNTVSIAKDANVIPAFEKQGIIGKSENLPIDDITDNIFSFELKEEFKQNKEAYLEYELFGLADASHATKSINDQIATGGVLLKLIHRGKKLENV